MNTAIQTEINHTDAPLKTACERLADDFESPPPYRKRRTSEGLWVMLDAHGDSVLWSEQEVAVDAAVEALNEAPLPRETFGQTMARILSAGGSRRCNTLMQ